MKVYGKTCYADFGGRDGEGICDTDCQWYPKTGECPMWIPHRDFDTEQDLNRKLAEVG